MGYILTLFLHAILTIIRLGKTRSVAVIWHVPPFTPPNSAGTQRRLIGIYGLINSHMMISYWFFATQFS
jgi:hypothetical protein